MSNKLIKIAVFFMLPFISLMARPIDILSKDNKIRYGQLKNGFTYYIKPTSENNGKVNMELILKVGSKQEDHDQVIMAHFMEHLALVRTKHFSHILSDNELLEKLHMKAGDIGGKTGGDATFYSFNYPSRRSIALDKGLLFFKDIVSGEIKFEVKDINGERGAIFEEYLMGEGQKWYKEWKMISLLSTCTKNIRKPADYQEYMRSFDVAPLKRFYKDWYRPDLMAIAVIGDIENVDAMEKKIKNTFSKIAIPKEVRSLNNCEGNYLSRPKQFVTLTDIEEIPKEIAAPFYFHFYFRDYKGGGENVVKMEEEANKRIFRQIFNQRLAEAQLGYNIPYSLSFIEDYKVPAVKLKVKTPKSHAKKGIQKAFSIYKDIRINGIEQNEFEKHKKQLLVNLKTTNKNNPDYWKEKIRQNFVNNKPLFSNQSGHLKQLSLADYNGWLKNYLVREPEDIAIIAPKGEDDISFTEETIRRWIKESWEDSRDYLFDIPNRLISNEKLASLVPGAILDRGTDELGGHKYVLQNGLTLILKAFEPNAGRYKNKIMLKSFSPIGASVFDDTNFLTALKAPEIVRHTGAGDWNKFQLANYLKDTSLNMGILPYISLHETGIETEVNLQDLETALQLIYLYIAEPRLDEEAFLDWKREEKKKSLRTSTRKEFIDFVRRQVAGMTDIKWDPSIEEVKLQNIHRLYKSLMQNPSKFTFIMTGAFSKEKVLPLLSKYLGNLPQASHIPYKTFKASKNRYLPHRPHKEIYYPNKNLMNVHIYQKFLKGMRGSITLQEEIEYAILAKVLEIQLSELRFKKKRAVYLALARSEIDRNNHTASINLMLSCAKKDFKKVQGDLRDIFAKLKKNGIENNLYHEVINTYIVPKYSDKQRYKNRRIMESLYEHYRFGKNLSHRKEIDKILDVLEKQNISEIAKKYLDDKFLMNFIAKPKPDL